MICVKSYDFISIHASAKEATIISFSRLSLSKHFNPRLREGGDNIDEIKSIYDSDFNPRLREGGDSKYSSSPKFIINFNPRLREGGDHVGAVVDHEPPISIHASAKEATSVGRDENIYRIYFNPRLREGGDFVGCPWRRILDISIHASAKEATTTPCHVPV